MKCVSHEATPEQPERVREQRLGLMEICGWRSETNFWWYRRWIEVLNQIEPSWKNQAEPDSFDHVWSYLIVVFVTFCSRGSGFMARMATHPAPQITWDAWSLSKLQILMERWRHRKNGETISSKWYLTKRHQFCIALSILPLHPWLHVAVLLPSPVLLRLVPFTSISGPSP